VNGPLRRTTALLAAVVSLAGAATADAATTVQDPSRNGWVADEPALSPAAVADPDFGQRFSAPVDGQVYASPVVDDGTLVVATETNRVYGLDPEDGTERWQTTFGEPFQANAPPVSCSDLQPTVGVTGTPALDPATHTAYMVGKENTAQSGQPQEGRMLMHALDTRTGQERLGWPVLLDGHADDDPSVAFEATWQLQRPQLLLLGGVVYAAMGGHCDHGTFRGWVFGVRAADGQVTTRWSSVGAGAIGGGIWQAGVGLASDGAGQLLLATGNGMSGPATPTTPVPGTEPPSGLSEAVVRLRVRGDGTLQTADFFTPRAADTLDAQDADFASGGPIVLPDVPYASGTTTGRLAVVGKEGIVYSLDGARLGGFKQGPGPAGAEGDDAGVFKGPGRPGVWGRPAVWPGAVPSSGPDDRGWLLVPATGFSFDGSGGLDAYRMVGGRPAYCTSTDAALTPMGLGTTSPVVTSDGRAAGSATAWTVAMPDRYGEGAQLVAFDATPTSCGAHGLRRVRAFALGRGTRYAQVTATGGRIYAGTLDGHVVSYGSPAAPGLRTSGGATGATTIGQSSTVMVHLRAEGVAVHVAGGDVRGAAFSLPAPVSAFDLAPGQARDIAVRFTPSAVGNAGGTLRLQTGEGEVPVALSGRGRAAGPFLQSSANVVDFGTVEVGNDAEQTVVLENGGTQTLTITGVVGPGAPMSLPDVPAFPFTLAPDEQRAVTVRYAPTRAGATETELRWLDDGVEPAAGRDLTVLGAAGVRGRVTGPASLAFGPVAPGATATLPLAFTNDGDLPLPLTRFKVPTDPAFTVGGRLDENAVVPPHGVLSGTVRFAPGAEGAFRSQIDYNAADTVRTARVVALDGLGRFPAPGAPAAAGAPQPAPSPGPTPPVVVPAPKAAAAPWVRALAVTGRTDGTRRLRLVAARPVTVRLTLAKRRGSRYVPLRGLRTATLRAGAVSLPLGEPWAGRPLTPGRYRVAVRSGTRVVSALFVVG
jgi:Abnormal spindle-like microcephaly-assoc'd, ASPM-SPD-2-Hydin/PQQ-like domain